jgi:hypothetical protein
MKSTSAFILNPSVASPNQSGETHGGSSRDCCGRVIDFSFTGEKRHAAKLGGGVSCEFLAIAIGGDWSLSAVHRFTSIGFE